jgi:hypothetical protein
LQSLEEDLVDAHRSVILNLQQWAIDDASLLAVTNEVDYDQDGEHMTFLLSDGEKFTFLIFIFSLLSPT